MRSFLKKFCTVMGLVLSAPLAQADSQRVQSWPNIIHQLQGRGISRIGDLDLAQFMREAQGRTGAGEIQWSQTSEEIPSVMAGERSSAYNISCAKTVVISKTIPLEFEYSRAALELHEVFGALCYDDSNYNLITVLELLAKLDDTRALERFIKLYSRTIFRQKNIHLAGGSSVGRGGDIDSIVIKNLIFHKILSSAKSVSDEFMVEYPRINFEPSHRTDVDFVVLDYQYRSIQLTKDIGNIRGGVKRDAYQDLITVSFPVHRWKNASTRASLLEEILKKITELIPVSVSQKMMNFTPQGCPLNIKIAIPETLDNSVLDIQNLRKSIARGCLNRSGMGPNEVMSPSPPKQDPPAEPDFYKFICTYNYRGKSDPWSFQVKAGRSNRYTTSGPAIGGSQYLGSAFISRNGELQLVEIEKTDLQGKRDWAIRQEQTSVAVDVLGETLTYNCVKK
jgi:hypothetical protein